MFGQQIDPSATITRRIVTLDCDSNRLSRLPSLPEKWSRLYALEYTLATGKSRDGGWGGLGLSLLMIKPDEMESGRTSISAVELIRYTDVDNWSGDPRYQADGYCNADTWTGGAWVCTDAGIDAV